MANFANGMALTTARYSMGLARLEKEGTRVCLSGLAGASVAAIAGRVVVFGPGTIKSVSGVTLSALLVPVSDRFWRQAGQAGDLPSSGFQGQATCCLMRSSWERQWGWMRIALTCEGETMRLDSRQASIRLQ